MPVKAQQANQGIYATPIEQQRTEPFAANTEFV